MEDIQFNEKLSEAVQQYPCLYDKACKDYKDRNIVSNAWINVAKEVDLEDGEIFSISFH